MVHVSAGQGLEQGGLAVEATADDHGDPLGDAHALHRARGGAELYPQQGRGGEGHGLGQGALVDARGPGKHRAVGHKGHQTAVGELASEGALVQDRAHVAV